MKKFLAPTLILAVILSPFVIEPASRVAASDCSRTSLGFIPLSDLLTDTYLGFQGGLYPGGSSFRPEDHEHAGVQRAHRISPLNTKGRAKKKGKIVLISIGMSNTSAEFQTFKSMADSDPRKNPRLVIVNGAQGGMPANHITDPRNPKSERFWQTIDNRLEQAGVTRRQVQVVWIKQADSRPTTSFPDHAITLQHELETIARVVKSRFPNVLLAYYSSRIYAGYATTTLNPEPYAYESGFAVKWMIEKQIDGSPDLNYEPSRGPVLSPWLAWGPYLWADGLAPRADGLIWECSDFNDDGTHPSGSARDKVALMLLEFFTRDATTRPWFLSPE